MNKICYKCKETKLVTAFYKDKQKKFGISGLCKVCHNIKSNAKWKKQKQTDIILYRFKEYERSAKYRGLEFELTLIQFRQLANINCYYCDDKINGIAFDRVDNTKGYTINNVVPCCSDCNKMKYTFTMEKFLEKCIKIVENWK